MEDYPRNLPEFEDRFNSEEACRSYLFKLRWAEGFRCSSCSHNVFWTRSNGLYECAKCGFQTSVTAGTIFQDTKKPLRFWFRAMWHLTSQKYGANALGLQRILGFGSYRTAWSWMQKLRRAMIRPGRDRLSGVIEVDESFIGGAKKPGKRGRGASGKVLVLIAVQVDGKKIGRIRLQRIANGSFKSLKPAIKDMIQPGAVIRTDGWLGYNALGKNGFVHEVIRDEAEVGDDLLPHCHQVASLLKRWLMGTLQGAVSHEHLEYYLDEFTFRFNRRTSKYRGKLFYRLVQQAVLIEPVPVKSLVKHIRGKLPKRYNKV